MLIFEFISLINIGLFVQLSFCVRRPPPLSSLVNLDLTTAITLSVTQSVLIAMFKLEDMEFITLIWILSLLFCVFYKLGRSPDSSWNTECIDSMLLCSNFKDLKWIVQIQVLMNLRHVSAHWIIAVMYLWYMHSFLFWFVRLLCSLSLVCKWRFYGNSWCILYKFWSRVETYFSLGSRSERFCNPCIRGQEQRL